MKAPRTAWWRVLVPAAVLVAATLPRAPTARPRWLDAHAAGPVRSAVLVARSDDGRREAWLDARRGLVVLGWPGALGDPVELGFAGFPRFVDDRLVYERGVDDGQRLLDVTTWVLDPDGARPRLARPGEDLGGWSPPAPASAGGPVRLCVDPGHGGADPGAVGNGLQEEDLVLDVALRYADLLADDTADASVGGAWDVLLTRVDDSDVSLLQRVTMANAFGADSYHSLHANGFSDRLANGTETFAFAEGTTAADLRDRIHERMIAAWGLTDRGTKTAGFYVLLNTAMPAALSEMAFVTNPGDAAVMADPANRQLMAEAHLLAVQEHHGFVPGLPDGATDGTLKGILHDASLGVGAPIAGGLVALGDGRFTTTNAAGYYEFELAAGAYAFAATAPGFEATGASETVTSGDVWESVGLQPAPGRPTFDMALGGSTLLLDVDADAGGFVWLALSLAPSAAPPAVGNKGALWPDAGLLLVLPLTTVPPSGSLSLGLAAPVIPGVDLHAQAYAPLAGVPRLSNGAAVHLP